MQEETRNLYMIPEHLDVDTAKENENVRFADRTALHLKNGLTEVVVEKRRVKPVNEHQQLLKKRISKEERKQVFSQLMSVQGSYAKRLQSKE